jgi:hypothetical protein
MSLVTSMGTPESVEIDVETLRAAKGPSVGNLGSRHGGSTSPVAAADSGAGSG